MRRINFGLRARVGLLAVIVPAVYFSAVGSKSAQAWLIGAALTGAWLIPSGLLVGTVAAYATTGEARRRRTQLLTKYPPERILECRLVGDAFVGVAEYGEIAADMLGSTIQPTKASIVLDGGFLQFFTADNGTRPVASVPIHGAQAGLVKVLVWGQSAWAVRLQGETIKRPITVAVSGSLLWGSSLGTRKRNAYLSEQLNHAALESRA